jgi:hypothetical protein
MNATKESIRAVADSLGITMTAEFVPFSKSRNAGEKRKSLNWRVTLHKGGRPVLTTDYSAGIAHAPGYSARETLDSRAVVDWECENGKAAWAGIVGMGPRAKIPHAPILPELADVLYSLSLDSSVLDHPTYETWAGEYGYDEDSRKGEAVYRACLEIALKMRAGLGEDGMRRLADAVQDY